jgi:hypothetical protein
MAPIYPKAQNPARILPIILALFAQPSKLTNYPNAKVDMHPATT